MKIQPRAALASASIILMIMAAAAMQIVWLPTSAIADPDPGMGGGMMGGGGGGDNTNAEPRKLTAAEEAFFESKIRPVLVQNCYKCHSSQGRAKAGLKVDTRAAMLTGGDGGPVIVPGDPDNSMLIQAISYANQDMQMPPNGKLPDAVIADFRAWVKMGAPDPRVPAGSMGMGSDSGSGMSSPQRPAPTNGENGGGIGTSEAPTEPAGPKSDPGDHWAFKKPVKPAVPAVGSPWARTDLDRFIYEAMAAKGIKPVKDASATAMLRRITFDLTGLPPAPEAIAPFEAAYKTSPEKAIAAEVDRLMETPQFGERWGRHWLDAARYAESNGAGPQNVTYPHAWRYRNYVIDAFNAGIPYDQFIREQIAGDIMAGKLTDKAEQDRLNIATGFLAFGPKPLKENDRRQFYADMVDEQIDAISRATFGLTVSCARCHDHKFDPIPTREYYAMAGILFSTETCYGTVANVGQVRRAGDLIELKALGGDGRQLDAGDLAKMRTRVAEMEDELREANRAYLADRDNQQLNRQRRVLQLQISRARARIDEYDALGNPLAFAMGVREGARVVNSPILLRGEVDQPSTVVARGFPTVLGVNVGPIPPNQSGRLQLAQWITSPDNPLTARVAVNRIWYHLLGRGIVGTLDNFGTRCTPPTNQKLLDYMAVRFQEQGWSVKQMVRTIMTSRVYGLAIAESAEGDAKDPDNELLWRANRRSLDGESLRDAMLAAADELDVERPGGSPMQQIGDQQVAGQVVNRAEQFATESGVRSVYLPVLRNALPDALDLFNFADPDAVNPERRDTIVPTQALYVLNGPLPIRAAHGTALRVRTATQDTDERIRLAWQLVLSRLPDANELARAKQFVVEFRKSLDDTFTQPQRRPFRRPGQGRPGRFQQDENAMSDDEREVETWSALAQALFASAEFRYLD